MLHAFTPGKILLDKYRIERVLGVGGMGVVVAARHIALDELVALKFMLGDAKPSDLTRFLREARATARLRSQHAARVMDVAALEDGTPFMVLEHLEGNDLAQLLRERGPFSVPSAIDAILQASEAIAEAHSLGIVHRDIKPANLFMTRAVDGAPCVKVLDFGIAKWESAGTAKMDPSQPMGSAPYMAPEQYAATTNIDGRTDVWALGATLFDLLIGKPPFHHDDVDSIPSMMHAVLHRPPMQLRALRADLPENLEIVLLRCLEKKQDDRFPSVAALVTALAPLGSEQAAIDAKRIAKTFGESETNPSEISRIGTATAPLSLAPASRHRIPHPRKKPRGIVLAIITFVVCIALGMLIVHVPFGRTTVQTLNTFAAPSIANIASSRTSPMTRVETPSPVEPTPSALPLRSAPSPSRRSSLVSSANAPASAAPRVLYDRRR